MVPKKGSDDWHSVGDFRAVNTQTNKEKYSIPSVLDFTSELHGTKIFSHIDLVKAFHQIPIAPKNAHKTAICTPFGLFESTRMQFGLCNDSSTFKRFIDEVTRGLHGVYAFIDDILIAPPTYVENIQHLRALFSRLDHYGLTIKSSKCTFGVPTLEILGFKFSKDGISPIPDRISAIQDFLRHTTLTQLHRFLANKKSEFSLQWSEEAEKAFLDAKNDLAEATLLKHPIPRAPLSLLTDASLFAIGSSLNQVSNGTTAFFPMTLSKCQTNWSAYDRELLAIYSSIKKFRNMLEDREFSIYIDQRPLADAFKRKPDKCSPRQLRHLDFISQFSTDIRYFKGTENIVADALSCIEIHEISNKILNFHEISLSQLNDSELQKLLTTNRVVEKHYFVLEDVVQSTKAKNRRIEKKMV
ncbi:Transposon Ty3-G Gag-Pol polyprotein [Araneus ventricosus]|uniref:Transposon Ty3-G Gag-Pol polyprotein n=1 Tax=Araneus ventricosus TaxID=182803 RepID=A0A4Y2USR4_ARAVE|nr:Transposon Ty3-G Gag-Pol polyprotein [Araneus ventricosus]